MPFARHSDPQTSHDAADSVRNLTATQRVILHLIEAKAMTDEGLISAYETAAHFRLAPRASESGIRSRRAELVRQGLIQDSGERQVLRSGRKAVVWTIA